MNNIDECISVIIPVYNKEKFLKRCLESIIKSTYRKLEIIIVDDGSIDNSLELCNEFIKKDSRISVYFKKMVAYHLHEIMGWKNVLENMLRLLIRMIPLKRTCFQN